MLLRKDVAFKWDDEKIESFQYIKEAIVMFFGKINFIKRFIPNFVKKVKPMNALLRKDVAFKWDDNNIESFEDIKEAIAIAPVLISPDYSHHFIIFSFASQDTIVGVLIQKNRDDYEQPIAFMSKTLKDVEVSL